MSIAVVYALLQAKHQGISGIQSVNLLVDTTIAAVNSQTEFTLTDGSGTDDIYNGQGIVLVDVSNSNVLSGHIISDYVGPTKTVTLDSTPNFTIVPGDGVKVPDKWPESELSSSDFPLVLIKKGEGTSRKIAGKAWSRDNWDAICFLAKSHQETYAQSIEEAHLYAQGFRDLYTDPNNRTLQAGPTLVQIESVTDEGISDTGLVEIEFRKKDYYGFRFNVQTVEWEQ